MLKQITFFAALALMASSAFADGFSHDLFAQNEGTFGGKTAKGGTCNLKIYAWARFDSYEVAIDGDGFGSEHGTSSKDSAGEFQKKWMKSYVEMTYGGWINSSGGETASTAVRIYFDRKSKITAYEISERGEVIATCTLER